MQDRVNILPIDRIWFNTRDCMNYLGVKRGFIDELRESGVLSYYKVGHTIFVKKSDLDNLIAERKITEKTSK